LYTPIIAITPNKRLIPELTLSWGINKALYKKFDRSALEGNFIKHLIPFLLQNKIIKKDEKIVIVYNARNKGSIASTKV